MDFMNAVSELDHTIFDIRRIAVCRCQAYRQRKRAQQ
jgi:hypothetical protein